MHLLINYLLCVRFSESKSPFLNSVTNVVEVLEAVHIEISTTKEKQLSLRYLNHQKESGNFNVYQ